MTDWTQKDPTEIEVKLWLWEHIKDYDGRAELAHAAFNHFARPFALSVLYQWTEAIPMKNDVIETWFKLREAMIAESKETTSIGLRPPSLREACYASVLAMRNANQIDPQTLEAFVNGLELGSMMALQGAWERSGL